MEAVIENGMASVEAGRWLVARGQPAAILGSSAPARGYRSPGGWWRRFISPDRQKLAFLETTGRIWCASASRPFLTRLDLGEPVFVVSEKLLLAPLSARKGAKLVKLIPFSWKNATCVTELEVGWALVATRSRVTRLVVKEGETLGVKPEAVVAWTGLAPTGFCPRLSLRDVLLPRRPKCLRFDFHGPAIVWTEGADG